MQRFQGKFVKGSEPASVYWQRRAIVAGAAAALVLVVVFGIKAFGGSGGGERSERDGAEPQEWIAPSASDTLKRPQVSPTQATEPSADSASPAVPACADEEVILQVVAAFDEVRSGTEVPVSVLVASAAEETCTADLGAVVVELASGDDLVYSTEHCDTAGSKTVELAEGAGQTVEFTLDGRASEPGCEGDRRRFPAGGYELRARLGSAVSQPAELAFT